MTDYSQEQRRAMRQAAWSWIAVTAALATVAVIALSGCNAVRFPEGDPRHISNDQLITMTRDHLAGFGEVDP